MKFKNGDVVKFVMPTNLTPTYEVSHDVLGDSPKGVMLLTDMAEDLASDNWKVVFEIKGEDGILKVSKVSDKNDTWYVDEDWFEKVEV